MWSCGFPVQLRKITRQFGRMHMQVNLFLVHNNANLQFKLKGNSEISPDQTIPISLSF